MNNPITTPEALDALLAIAGEQAEPIVVREGFRVWTLTEDDLGDWWAWSWREEGEDWMPRRAETLTLPLTVLFRPDAPTPTPVDLNAHYVNGRCVLDGCSGPHLQFGEVTSPTPTPADDNDEPGWLDDPNRVPTTPADCQPGEGRRCIALKPHAPGLCVIVNDAQAEESTFSIWADGATPEQREAIYSAAMDAAWAASEGMTGVSVGGAGALNPAPADEVTP